jgi:hypothetical protein
MMADKIPVKFCNDNSKRYNSHAFFSTIEHHHISDYSGDKTCNIMIVGFDFSPTLQEGTLRSYLVIVRKQTSE